MADLETEFKAWRETRQQSKQFQLEQAWKQHQEELAAGGAIRAETPEKNFPIGATAGAIAGAFTGPFAPVMIPIGAVGGEAIQQIVEHVIGSEAAPKTTGEAIERMSIEAILSSLGGGVGGKTGQLAAKGVSSAFQAEALPAAKAAHDFAMSGAPLKGTELIPAGSILREMPVLPAQLTGTTTQEIMQNIGEASFVGASFYNTWQKASQEGMQALADTFSSAMGSRMTKGELGDAIVMAIKDNREAAKIPARKLYSDVETRVGDKKFISTASMKRSIKDLYAVSKELKGLGSKIGGDDVIEHINMLDDTMSFLGAQALRSRLLALKDEMASRVSAKAPALKTLSDTVDAVDSAIASGLGRKDKTALNMWRKANQLWAGQEDRFNNDFLKGLIKSAEQYHGGTPDKVFEQIFRPGGFGTDVVRVRKALGKDSEEFKNLKRMAWEHIIDKAANLETGELIAKRLERTLASYDKGAIQQMFDKRELEWVDNFANLARQQQKATKSGLGRMLIQMKQSGIAMEVVGGGAAVVMGAPAFTFVITPALLSKLMVSPTGRDLLVRGLQTPMSNANAGLISGRILGLLGSETAGYAVESEVKEAFKPKQEY